MYNILVCDDEKDIVEALGIYLSAEGYQVTKAYNGQEACEKLKTGDVQLVLMDIMMPVMDGITAMNKIRKMSNVPVILLTAKSEDTDKILGLSVGADDYITKPFNPVVMIARVKAQLRRYMMLGGNVPKEPEADTLTIGGVCLDDRAKKVTIDGEYGKPHQNRVCNPEIPDGTSEYGLCTEGYLPGCLGGCTVRTGGHRCGTYSPLA